MLGCRHRCAEQLTEHNIEQLILRSIRGVSNKAADEMKHFAIAECANEVVALILEKIIGEPHVAG